MKPWPRIRRIKCAKSLVQNVSLSGQGDPDALANVVSAHLNRNPAFITITFLFKYLKCVLAP